MPDVKATGKCVKTVSENFQNQAVIKLRIIFYGKKNYIIRSSFDIPGA